MLVDRANQHHQHDQQRHHREDPRANGGAITAHEMYSTTGGRVAPLSSVAEGL